MSNHRSTQDRVSNDPQLSNFEPGTALAVGRIQSLATKTSQQASASLRFANAQVAALTAQMEARRKATTR